MISSISRSDLSNTTNTLFLVYNSTWTRREFVLILRRKYRDYVNRWRVVRGLSGESWEESGKRAEFARNGSNESVTRNRTANELVL